MIGIDHPPNQPALPRMMMIITLTFCARYGAQPAVLQADKELMYQRPRRRG
jgi:hypothetical protein